MAITFDSHGEQVTAGSNTNAFSLTNTAGTLLVVYVAWLGTSDTITAATYNGVALTPVTTATGSNLSSQMFYLVNPATGANTLSFTRSNSSGNFFVNAATYSGAKQTGQPDASTSLSSQTVTSWTVTLTTIADNCITVVGVECDTGGLVAGTGSTERSALAATSLYDSNGPIHPAGSTSMSGSATASSSQYIMASFAPTTGTAYTKTVTESITLTDTLVKAATRPLIEAITVSATLLKTPTRILAEAITVTDTIQRSLTRTLAEAITATASVLKTATRTLSEAITVMDAFLGTRLRVGTFTEALLFGPPFNYIRNNSMQGTVTGTPGTPPDNWSLTTTGGLSHTIVGTGTDANGIDYIDVRWFGTPAGNLQNNTEISGIIPAVNGDVFMTSIYLAVVGGDTTNVTSVLQRWQQRQSDGTNISNTNGGQLVSLLTSTLTRFSSTVNINQALAAYLVPGFFLGFNASTAVDITLRIGSPQIERGTVVNPPVRTASFARGDELLIRTISRPFVEALTLTDTIIRTIARLIVESITVTASFIRTTSRTLLEALTVSDLLLKGATRTLSDAITASAVLVKTGGKTLTQAISMTATLLRVLARTLSDATTVSDAVVKGAARTLTELLQFGPVINYIRNNAMQGAVVGTPGTAPTNWGLGGLAGLSSQIVGTGTDANGIDYLDVRYFGTTNTTGGYFFVFETNSAISSAQNQVWTESAYVAVVAGSLNNVTAIKFDQVSYPIGNDNGGSDFSTSINATMTRFSFTLTIPNVGNTNIQPRITFSCNNASAVDVTLRVGSPQMELSAVANPPVRTTGNAHGNELLTRSTTRTLTDPLTVTDTFLRVIGRTIAEAITATATLLKGPSRTLSQAVTVTPSMIRTTSRSLLETFTVTILIADKTLMRALAEQLSVTDTINLHILTKMRKGIALLSTRLVKGAPLRTLIEKIVLKSKNDKTIL